MDLWKDDKGNIYEQAKNGKGEAEETEYSINKGQVIKEIAATATKAAVVVGALYLLWKGVEFVVTIPICWGCGVLSPL